MDPVANLREQRELARDIIALRERHPHGHVRLHEVGDRLAELVLALDEWRQRGGFDPYASA